MASVRTGDDQNNGASNCPQIANREQRDTDGEGIGDACDATPGIEPGEVVLRNNKKRAHAASSSPYS
jgi:hypothetical protein